MDVANGHMYWADSGLDDRFGNIWQANMDGTGGRELSDGAAGYAR